MFEFFIALFGGSYYLGKYANEKSAHRKYDREFQDYRNRAKQLMSKIEASAELDREIENYINCGNNLDKIFKELEEDFIFIFGKDWKDKILLPGMTGYWDGYRKKSGYWYATGRERSVYNDHAYWVKHLLLAKQGKCYFLYSVDGGYDHFRKDNKQICKFAQRLEENLIKYGNCDPEDVKLYYDKYLEDIYNSGRLVFKACFMPSGSYTRLW